MAALITAAVSVRIPLIFYFKKKKKETTGKEMQPEKMDKLEKLVLHMVFGNIQSKTKTMGKKKKRLLAWLIKTSFGSGTGLT